MGDKLYDYYYRRNKFFLSSIGIWPHQGLFGRFVFTSLTFVFGMCQVVLQTGGMITAASQDREVFLESIAPVVVNGIVLPKYINFLYNKSKMTILYNEVIQDWKAFLNSEEIEIMRVYAKKTERTCAIYAACVYGGMTPVLILPTVPAVLEACGLLNQTGPKILPFPVQYLVDIDKYYYQVIFEAFMGSFYLIMIVVACDTMFVLYLRHACSLFKIIGNRLNNIIREDENYNNAFFKKDLSYKRVVSCVRLHNKTLKFVEFIEGSHATGFFAQLGCNVVGITFTGFQAVILLDRPSESFRYLTFTFAQLSHLYFQCSPPQTLFDDSLELSDETNNGKWYYASNRTKHALRMLMMRTRKPCKITAGKFFPLNIVTFTSVLRTSMSYFTVLSSQH